MLKDKIKSYLGANKKYAIKLLSNLIEISTINPPGENYEKMVGFLEGECRKLGLAARKYLTPKHVLDEYGVKGGSKRISLVADLDKGCRKTFHINFHYDVVPATNKWKTDPFRAMIKDGRIYGRGSEDMKGTIASVLFALKALKEAGRRVPRDMAVVGFDDNEHAKGFSPPLTTIRQPLAQMGRDAVDILIRQIERQISWPVSKRYLPKLIVRKTA